MLAQRRERSPSGLSSIRCATKCLYTLSPASVPFAAASARARARASSPSLKTCLRPFSAPGFEPRHIARHGAGASTASPATPNFGASLRTSASGRSPPPRATPTATPGSTGAKLAIGRVLKERTRHAALPQCLPRPPSTVEGRRLPPPSRAREVESVGRGRRAAEAPRQHPARLPGRVELKRAPAPLRHGPELHGPGRKAAGVHGE